MNSYEQVSKFNTDKHIEFIDNEYAQKQVVSSATREETPQNIIDSKVVDSSSEGVPSEFKHFTSNSYCMEDQDLDIHQTINSSLGLKNDFNANSHGVLNYLRSDVSNERTRKTIKTFDQSIYDQQKVRENETLLKNDFKRKNVDWSGPPNINGYKSNYCQGFMSTTNDQLIDHFSQKMPQMNMNQNMATHQPFSVDMYARQYDQFMSEQYYLNEKRIMTQQE